MSVKCILLLWIQIEKQCLVWIFLFFSFCCCFHVIRYLLLDKKHHIPIQAFTTALKMMQVFVHFFYFFYILPCVIFISVQSGSKWWRYLLMVVVFLFHLVFFSSLCNLVQSDCGTCCSLVFFSRHYLCCTVNRAPMAFECLGKMICHFQGLESLWKINGSTEVLESLKKWMVHLRSLKVCGLDFSCQGKEPVKPWLRWS